VSDLATAIRLALRRDDPRLRRAREAEGAAPEVAELAAEVRALQRTVAVLAAALEHHVLTSSQVASICRELARRDDAEDEAPEAALPDDQRTAALEASAYRGAVPGAPRLRCAACGKAISEDDPELRDTRGRVCVVCFQRG
jgi:hypothetical protein